MVGTIERIMQSDTQPDDKKILARVKVSLVYLKYVGLAWLILIVGLFILPVLSSQLLMEISGRIDPSVMYSLLLTGPTSVGPVWLMMLLIIIGWPYIAFIVWAVKDSRKFKAQGIKTRPYLWGLGMVYPLIIIVFPLYLIRRNITWAKKGGVDSLVANTENAEIPEKQKKKRKWARVGVAILLTWFVVIPLVVSLLTQIGIRNRAVGNFLVNLSLSISCTSGKSGCDELRPLPKILQNKKIIFNDDTSIQFDPRYRPEIGLTDLDTLGSFNTNHMGFERDKTVDPKLGERGYLSEREYKIVRAVYHYNCSYCIDSSDYAYVVLEDSKGNRFSSLLEHDYWNPSMETARTLQWDERAPYDLGRDGELGKLIDITPTSTQ